MFNGIIFNTGSVKIIKNSKKSKLIGIKSSLKFKKAAWRLSSLELKPHLTKIPSSFLPWSLNNLALLTKLDIKLLGTI